MSDDINKEILRGLEVISAQLEAIGKGVSRIAMILTIFFAIFIVGVIFIWLF